MSLYFILFLHLLSAQPEGSINITLSEKEVSLGKAITCTLRAITDVNPKFRPAIIPPDFSSFNIKDYSSTQSEVDNKVILEQIYQIQPVMEGNLAIEPVTFNILDEDDNVVSSYQTDSTYVKVGPMLSADKQMRPIRATLEVARDWVRMSIIGGSTLLTALLTWLTIYLIKRHRRKLAEMQNMITEAPKRPAWEIALEQLEELKSKRYVEDYKFMPFHVELSLILREFLENRFEFNAVEFTTTEIIRAFRKIEKSKSWIDDCINTLQICDLVKFADYDSSPAEMQHLFDQTERLVLEDKKVKRAA
jgi:hypothetical protein